MRELMEKRKTLFSSVHVQSGREGSFSNRQFWAELSLTVVCVDSFKTNWHHRRPCLYLTHATLVMLLHLLSDRCLQAPTVG